MAGIADIRSALAARRPCLIPADEKSHAAVAIILRETPRDLRLLFIERAERQGDPWSGHIAFPGGRVGPCDPSPRLCAERETHEEVGLRLRPDEYLGRLDDVTGATLPVLVSGFVYHIRHSGPLEPNHEVRDAFWVCLDSLVDTGRHVECAFRFRGRERLYPAIDLLGPGRPVLWGLTYRLVANFLHLLGHRIP